MSDRLRVQVGGGILILIAYFVVLFFMPDAKKYAGIVGLIMYGVSWAFLRAIRKTED